MDRLGAFLWNLPRRLFRLVVILWFVAGITPEWVAILIGMVVAMFAWDAWRLRGIEL